MASALRMCDNVRVSVCVYVAPEGRRLSWPELVCAVVLRASHVGMCEALLTSRRTLLFVRAADTTNAVTGDKHPRHHQCGTSSRPWTIATSRRGQRINVTVVDLTLHHPTDSEQGSTHNHPTGCSHLLPSIAVYTTFIILRPISYCSL